MPPSSPNQGASLGVVGNSNLINNPKRITINQLDNGFLIDMQKVDTYGTKMDVSLDLEGAMKIASDYFAQ